MFNAVVTPSVLYGSGSWAMTLEREARLRTAQRRMSRKIFGGGRKAARDEEEAGEKIEETWIEWVKRTTREAEGAGRKANVVDWVEEQRRRKWRWAGHVARRADLRWSKAMLDWEPVAGERRWGRPITRWEDSLVRFAKSQGVDWRQCAQDRERWSSLEEEFARTGESRRSRSR